MHRCCFLLLLAGCFQSIAPDAPDASMIVAGDDDAATMGGGRIGTTPIGDGSFTSRVDSTSITEWVHGEFATGTEVATSESWDLRFQRFHVSTNGGVTGAGGVEVVPITGIAFADVTSAPTTGWLGDAADGDDTNMDPDYAFEQGDGWYAYDEMTHVLTPRPVVWVVKRTGGSMIKLEITKYYDDAGTAGWFSLHWSPM